ncbi:MAG: lamin tail domain-containing protein [Bacteroidetes bacterium]|nr:lamin tail domain-containing protein [Bacteroidota bacterium]
MYYRFVFLGFIILCLNLKASAQIIVNEFQPIPTGDEPEWVELYNPSDQIITLNKWYLHDTRTVVSMPAVSFPPQGYIIITGDSLSLIATKVIPVNVPIIEIKLPTLNNTTDAIVLRRSDSTMMDSVYYSTKWGIRGISYERKYEDKPAISALNLFPSQSPDSSTIGYQNSISPRSIDIAVSSFVYIRSSRTLIATARNVGKSRLQSANLSIYTDKNENSLFDTDELIEQKTISYLAPGDSVLLSITMDQLYSLINIYGNIRCLAKSTTENDQRHSNDSLLQNAYISFPVGSVLINEFMFDPISGFSEFVELFNTANTNISLSGFRLHDRPTSSGADTFHIDKLNISPSGYGVIAWDSSFFKQFPLLFGASNVYCKKTTLNLNSDADAIVLRDGNGLVIDSMVYSSKWHDHSLGITKGVSLEKINPTLPSGAPTSWTSCGNRAIGATPALLNSISHEIGSGSISASPNPFSPQSLNKQQTVISFKLDERNAVVSAIIYNLNGAIVRTLLNAQYTSSEGAVVWNGRDDNDNLLPPGAYILVLEAINTTTSQVRQQKLLLIIG